MKSVLLTEYPSSLELQTYVFSHFEEYIELLASVFCVSLI